ncbi:MAG: DNA polymerase III subunit gamma/tau [Proteobacteria bacterium]|nr:DNA polymerase III subunit gamma/tau [Pseudomonadota bacterium]
MSYQVLALKYRPQTFEEVVGQPHVTFTLKNAILADRVAHAILFTGPRGTGKTTIARILAKAMNCKTGPTPTPCNLCNTCKDIIEGHCSDVFEIDGASNNSVDQIRDLRENVTYMPATAAYKIYIIDEVHMLSTAAFNALLKTLEEPPEHVMFIFATTEVHKIPGTILSRCQRHDLGRIPLEQISDHLNWLCTQEEFTLSRESLDLISLEADGSIRDALSLLDRILSASPDKQVDHDKVIENLGVMDRTLMYDIATAVFQKDGAQLIRMVEIVDDSGLDLKKFFSDLILHFRNLSVIKLCGPQHTAINLSEVEKAKLAQAVHGLSPTYLGILLQLLLNEESLVKFSSHTKTAVEMVLLKMIQISPGAELDQIIDKLDLLARQINSKLTGPADSAHGKPEECITPAKASLVDIPTETGSPVVSAESSKSLDTACLKTDDTQSFSAPMASAPKTWTDFLGEIEKKLPFIFALLSRGQVDTSGNDTIQVCLSNCTAFDKSRLKIKKEELITLCKNFLGKPLEITILSKTDPPGLPDKEKAKLSALAHNHPFVLDAQRIFDGEIIN